MIDHCRYLRSEVVVHALCILQRKTEVHNLWLKESSQFMTKRVTIDFFLPPLYPRPAGRGGAGTGAGSGGRGSEWSVALHGPALNGHLGVKLGGASPRV